ncbi:SRPBCC family protein [uncultured Friedmanniella sp.]|uniref:SRPBCC family protein n=1 Tax=uncultured Friedmanniella sp. TaxID=335381 RepID=UPI0035CAA29C
MATNHGTASCSPEAVFAVLADGWLYPTWVVGASRIRDVEASWPAEGAKIHHSFGVWPLLINDSTSILEWDPPRRAVLKARGWPMGSAKVVLEVEPTPSGCRMTLQEDAIEGPGTLLPKPARDALIHVRNTETLRRLTYLAEGRAAGR